MDDEDLYQGEYDLILGEDDDDVAFLVHGRELKISRFRLAGYDDEGRFWLSVDVAKELGLIN